MDPPNIWLEGGVLLLTSSFPHRVHMHSLPHLSFLPPIVPPTSAIPIVDIPHITDPPAGSLEPCIRALAHDCGTNYTEEGGAWKGHQDGRSQP